MYENIVSWDEPDHCYVIPRFLPSSRDLDSPGTNIIGAGCCKYVFNLTSNTKQNIVRTKIGVNLTLKSSWTLLALLTLFGE